MLDPITSGGVPSAQGCWERAYMLERLQADDFVGLEMFLGRYGTVRNFTRHNVSARWQPTYVTCRMGSTYVIVIQGTENVQQIILHMAGVAFTEVVDEKGIRNSEWQMVASAIWDDLRQDFAGFDPPTLVDICGHSYGGAVASLLARRMYEDQPGLSYSVCTFGSPKCTGGVLPTVTISQNVRVRHRNDPVPSLPPANLTVALRQIASASAVTRSAFIQWAREGQGVLVSRDDEFTQSYSENEADLQAWKAGYSLWVDSHNITRYRLALELPGVVLTPPQTLPVTPAVEQAIAGQVPAPLVPDEPSPSGLAGINALYFGTGSPVDAGNLLFWESTSLTVAGTPTVRTSSNIGVLSSGGASMAVESGYTKVTLCINNSRNGRLESHVYPAALSSSAIGPAVNALLNARANLLGTNFANPLAAAKSRSTPQIEFVKLQDAFYPKLGYILDLSDAKFFGPAKTGLYPADVLSTALSLRFVGDEKYDFQEGAPLVAQSRYVSLQINGQPDDAVELGQYNWGFTRDTDVFAQALLNYCDFLIAGSTEGWGFVGLNSHQLKQPVVKWILNTPVLPAVPYWSFQLTGTPFVTGDRIRITGVNPNFNGTFFVQLNADNTYSMKNAPATGRPVPTGGSAQRVGGASGSRLMAWYKYTSYLVNRSHNGFPQIKTTKKNPGREFLNLTFRSKSRRKR